MSSRRKWSLEEDNFLLRVFKEKLPELKEQSKRRKGVPYHLISSRYLPHRSSKQIKERWENVLNPKLRKGKWSSGEIKKLFQLMIKYGQSWSQIHEAFETRSFHCIKSKGRYLLGEIVRPAVKSGTAKKGVLRSYLTQEEETTLLEAHRRHGYDKEKMCYELNFELSCAEIERKLISFCPCVHCKERFRRLNQEGVSFKTAWTRDKAQHLLEEHMKGNLQDEDLVNTSSACFDIKIEEDLDMTAEELWNETSQIVQAIDGKADLNDVCPDRVLRVKTEDERLSENNCCVEPSIPKIEDTEDYSESKMTTNLEFDLNTIYTDLIENRHAETDKRKREDYYVDRLEKKMKSLKAERIQTTLLEAAKSFDPVCKDDASYHNVIARVMLAFYDETQLLKFCKAAVDARIEIFSPSIAYLLDQTMENGDDPRYDIHFCFPKDVSFDPSKPVGSLLYDADSCLCIDQTDNVTETLQLRTHLGTHWFYDQPSVLHATYLLIHMFPRLLEKGEVWMHTRKLKANGDEGIYLVKVVKDNKCCHMDYQDVSEQFPALLQLRNELI